MQTQQQSQFRQKAMLQLSEQNVDDFRRCKEQFIAEQTNQQHQQ